MSKVTEKQEAKKQQIKEILYEPFTKKGIEHVTTNEILELVNIPNSTFFRLFKTKEILLKEMYYDVLDEVLTFRDDYTGSDFKEFLFYDWDNAIQYAFANQIKYSFFLFYQFHPFVDAFDHPTLKTHLDLYRILYEDAEKRNIIDVPDFEYLNNSYNDNVIMVTKYLASTTDTYNPDLSRELFEKYWKSIEA